jgi:tetratricopeptide (TPR) repeat protein/cellulose synthase/poly-beta-1,6-N-acetylglucosamine synthase-like glycosyltransferase
MERLRSRQIVIAVSTLVCLFYLGYRALFTLNLTTPYAVFASVFLYAGEFFGVMSVLLFFLQVWDTREPPQQPILEGRTVDVFVPTYNEDPAILRATLEACERMTYPHRTYLCDDGGTDARCNDPDPKKATAARERAAQLKAICAELGVTYMTRPRNEHAKAGNLNHAFEKTDGEFLIIFDADHVPEPHFIDRLIGYFRDEKLGFVQTPHAFYNFDSFQALHDHERRHYWEEGHLFYNVIQPGRNRWGCPIFAGAAALFRRKALEDVGYIATETITEDMHTGMRMHAKGWRSLGISERMIVGQAAPDITTFHTQRLRWGEGNLSIMAYDNPLTMRGLTFPQRLCYFGSMIHWAGGLFKLAIYLTPILMMFTGVPPVNQFTWTLAGITLLYLLVATVGVRIASKGYLSIISAELFCMVNFWTQIRGTLRATFWRKFQSFVVTSKRGRQSKSIWPFIRPQVYLAGVSVLALVWGWARVLWGISEDATKPIIPSLWIILHLWLIVECIRRALRPEDKRFSYRHAVRIPVAYEFQGVENDDGQLIRQVQGVKLEEMTAMGVTVDVSEGGIGLVTYCRLPVGTVLSLTLWARGESLECEGKVRWVKELTPGVAGSAKGYRCGIAFRNLEPRQLDVVNRIALHYAVPRLYKDYEEGHRRSVWQRVAALVLRCLHPRRYAIRYAYNLPLVLRLGDDRGTTYFAVTEDVSRTSLAALLPTALPEGTRVAFLIPTPLGQVKGQARLVRGETRTYAARDYQFAVFELQHFEEQGRVTLESLINPRENRQLTSVLAPRRELRRVPMLRPAASFAAAMLPLTLLALCAFRFLYRDDFFLRDLVAQKTPPSAEQLERLDSIYEAALASRHPSSDRLSFLMRMMTRLDRKEELRQVALLLAPRDRGNVDLQIALAQALDNTKDYDHAEEEYQRLLERAQKRSLPAAQRRELLLGAGRTSVHAGKLERAAERFRELLRLYPNDASLRNETAGVLLSADKPKEAIALFQGVEPDLDGRLLLVGIHARLGNYNAAEKEARQVLALKPGDAQAEQLLADVLSWKKGFAQSRAIYERLAAVRGKDAGLELRLAQIALWSKSYPEALARFQALIDRGNEKPEVLRGYVDAASSSDNLGEPQRRVALKLYDQLLTAQTDDAILLARLAWVLQRVNEADKATVLLDRAVTMKPSDPALRRQLFGALVTAGRIQDALEGVDPERIDLETRRYLVGLHLKNRNFTAAAAQCRSILKEDPSDIKTERQLADILSWNKKYKESLELFEQLRRKLPNDTEIPLRIAEVTMWSGAYDKALVVLLFQTLLEKDFYQPTAQRGFIDAAGNVEKLTPEQQQLTLRIAEGVRTTDVKDVPFLARLGWVLHREGQTARAEELLDRVAALKPQDPAARKELAGILAAVGKSAEAVQMYEGLTLTAEDRFRLAGLYAAAKRYDAAAVECRAFLQAQPNDARGRRLLADVLSWDRKYTESLVLLRGLVREAPGDSELKGRLAEVLLWSGDGDAALPYFRTLLQAKFKQPKRWRDFVDAAAAAAKLTPADSALAARIGESLHADQTTDVALLTRLAWIQLRTSAPRAKERAAELLDRALSLKPADAAARRELAGVLGAAGRTREALGLFEGLALGRDDRYLLASLNAGARDYEAALEQCQALLRGKPNDRKALRLKADVLSWAGSYKEALALLGRLAQEEPTSDELKVRVAEVTLWSGEREKALVLFQGLLEAKFDRPAAWAGFISAASSADKLTPAQKKLAAQIADREDALPEDAVLLSRLGWVLHRSGDSAQAQAVLDRAVSLKPKDPAVRRGLAGVLAAAGRAKESLALYAGLTLDTEDYYRLVSLHSATKNFTEAERQCRLLLARNPRDGKARRLLADVLSWGGKFKDALELFEELAKEEPGDEGLQLRLAEVALWSGAYARALPLFQGLLEAKFDRPLVWAGFIAAAAATDKLTPAQIDLAGRICEATETTSEDAALLARLGWVLYREGNKDKAQRVLERALTLKPADAVVRRELAGVLAAVGRGQEALALYKDLRLTLEDRRRLADLHTSMKHFDAAAAECRAILKEVPGDSRTRRLLADLLSWGRHFRESLALFEQLIKDNPGDDSLKVRRAEVTLWSGQTDQALALLRALLVEKFDRPDLWTGYVNAAAAARTLSEEDDRLVRKIGATIHPDESKDAPALMRLAWVLTRLGDRKQAGTLLDRVLALKPASAELRKELAGVLAAAGRAREAVGLYQGLTLTREDRYQLTLIHAGARDYEAALEQVRLLLKDRPDDGKARRLEADVLSWAGRYKEALVLLERFAKEEPASDELKVRVAEVTLWSGEREKALGLFQELLQVKFDRPGAWAGFVAAAASAEKITPAQRELIGKIDKQAADSRDAAFLSRLAWVFYREKNRERAEELLSRALALKPAEPVVKRELAGVLGAAGRHKEALALYDGLPLSLEDRYRLAGLHSAVKNYPAAAEQCRDILKEKPGDAVARRKLADVLSWDRQYKESLALFDGLLKEKPADEELKLRRAEVTLWSRDYDGALERFQPLLEAKFEQPKLWPTFVDAAASARTLTADTAPLAERIATRTLAAKSDSVTLHSRLAWVLFRLKQKERAAVLLDRALALKPAKPAERKELAGVLAAVGRRTQALELYRGLDLDPEDRFTIAALYAADKKLDDAERELRAALEAKPDDPKVRLMLADVLLWNKKYVEAGKLYKALHEANPDDPALPLRFAQLALWGGQYDDAVVKFAALLAAAPDQPEHWRGFIDAAASATKVAVDHKRLVLHIYEGMRKNPPKEGVLLARLGWVLRRLNEKEKAVEVLKQALALDVNSRSIRAQLADLLYEVGRYDEAEKHFSILLRNRGVGKE